MIVSELLSEREKTHGDFYKQASSAQTLKKVMSDMPNWEKMPAYMKESLELIATKISRMGHGDYTEEDHAKDGSGYFQLIVRQLEI